MRWTRVFQRIYLAARAAASAFFRERCTASLRPVCLSSVGTSALTLPLDIDTCAGVELYKQQGAERRLSRFERGYELGIFAAAGICKTVWRLRLVSHTGGTALRFRLAANRAQRGEASAGETPREIFSSKGAKQ